MLFVAATVSAALAVPAGASPHAGNWDTLGIATAAAGSNSGHVSVRSYEQYDVIRICSDASVRLTDLRVNFYNGDRQDIALGATVPGGGCTSAIDLKGNQRSIQRVRMRFEPTQAKLRVEAR
jgi:hypothetical protein